jgi:hypothetical protein
MRIFASILIMLGANAQRFHTKLMCCLESQNGTCYEELTACIQASRVGGRDSTVYLAEIYGVALDCGFRTLALEIRDAEPDQMMRKHLNMQLLNHAIATGQLEDAERLVGSTPDPDEGRAKVAESFAMRGEFRRSAEVTRQISSPRISGVEWFRIAALASNSDRTLSDFAMGQGAVSLKALDSLVETQGTETLAQSVFAQIMRSPHKSPLKVVNQVCQDRSDDFREGIYKELLQLFSRSADSVHFQQLVHELLRQPVDAAISGSSSYSLLNDTVMGRLDDLGALLVRSGADVEKTLPAMLGQLQLDRSFAERMPNESHIKSAQNLAAAMQAADADKAFSDKIYFEAIDELTNRGRFDSAFELVRHLHRREDALSRIGSRALSMGESKVAGEAVRQWEIVRSPFDENVFEYKANQEWMPVLVKFEKQTILGQMIRASRTAEQILRESQVASAKGGLNMVEAANRVTAAITMAEALAGVDQRAAAEQLIVAVSERLESIQLGTLQATLASRLAEKAVDVLNLAGATRLLTPDTNREVRRALINKICYEFGRMGKQSSFDTFLATFATSDEAVSGRLSFVKGMVKAKLCEN